jgi:hypothetical protein
LLPDLLFLLLLKVKAHGKNKGYQNQNLVDHLIF